MTIKTTADIQERRRAYRDAVLDIQYREQELYRKHAMELEDIDDTEERKKKWIAYNKARLEREKIDKEFLKQFNIEPLQIGRIYYHARLGRHVAEDFQGNILDDSDPAIKGEIDHVRMCEEQYDYTMSRLAIDKCST